MQIIKKENNASVVSVILLTLIIVLTVINQGGYFPGGIVAAGILCAVMLFKSGIKVSCIEITGLIFCIWYMFCSLKSGFLWENTAKGIMPLTALMFWLILPDEKEDMRNLLGKVLRVSSYIAVLGVIICVVSSIGAGRLQRLIFPFQYANVSGIFFGVLFILSRYNEDERIRKIQYIFFVPLLLTQSVGAIGLSVVAELFLSKSKKKTLILTSIILLLAVILRGRVYQSFGTFAERLLHIHDGLLCMADNPVFGIGAGEWGIFKSIYQTGFYDAAEIHSSIISVGVNSGIVGFILFLAVIVFSLINIKFSDKSHVASVFMLLLHSCFDFTLSFLGAVMLLMIIVKQGEKKSEKRIYANGILQKIIAGILLLIFLFFTIGLAKSANFQKLRNVKKISAEYDDDWMLKCSKSAKELYIDALYASGEKERLVDVLDGMEKPHNAHSIILKSQSLDDWGVVLDGLRHQPYNEQLYEIREMCDDSATLAEIENIYNNAVNSMSWIGKFLYKFLGEKI